MTLAISRPVVRIFEAVSLAFPRTVTMPPGVISPLPPCLICRHYSPLPPAKQFYLKGDEGEGLGVVCQACAADRDDAELEKKVLSSLDQTAAPPIAAEPDLASPLDWVEKAARDWSARASGTRAHTEPA
jgi:hypothetical protein